MSTPLAATALVRIHRRISQPLCVVEQTRVPQPLRLRRVADPDPEVEESIRLAGDLARRVHVLPLPPIEHCLDGRTPSGPAESTTAGTAKFELVTSGIFPIPSPLVRRQRTPTGGTRKGRTTGRASWLLEIGNSIVRLGHRS